MQRAAFDGSGVGMRMRIASCCSAGSIAMLAAHATSQETKPCTGDAQLRVTNAVGAATTTCCCQSTRRQSGHHTRKTIPSYHRKAKCGPSPHLDLAHQCNRRLVRRIVAQAPQSCHPLLPGPALRQEKQQQNASDRLAGCCGERETMNEVCHLRVPFRAARQPRRRSASNELQKAGGQHNQPVLKRTAEQGGCRQRKVHRR